MKKTIYLLTLFTLSLTHPLFSSPEGEANYKIAASYFTDVLNNGKTELVDEIFAEDFLFVGIPKTLTN